MVSVCTVVFAVLTSILAKFITLILTYVFPHEKITVKSVLVCLLTGAGMLLMVL